LQRNEERMISHGKFFLLGSHFPIISWKKNETYFREENSKTDIENENEMGLLENQSSR